MDILIIEDEPIYVIGLQSLLKETAGANVVGHARSARAAFALIDSLQPHVVLLDIGLPGMDGFAATREILRRSSARVLILSGRSGAFDVAEAVRAGAFGFVTKDDTPEVLVEAIRKVSAGERFFTTTLEKSAQDVTRLAEPRDALAKLSVREREVFALLVRGVANGQAARELCISRKTLDTHRHHIYEKLGCHSIAELVRFAARNVLLEEQRRSNGVVEAAQP